MSPLQGFYCFLPFPGALPQATIFHPFGVIRSAYAVSLANLFVATRIHEGLLVRLPGQAGRPGQSHNIIWIGLSFAQKPALIAPKGRQIVARGNAPRKVREKPSAPTG